MCVLLFLLFVFSMRLKRDVMEGGGVKSLIQIYSLTYAHLLSQSHSQTIQNWHLFFSFSNPPPPPPGFCSLFFLQTFQVAYFIALYSGW